MKDEACVSFLQWVLPQLRMRWAGFRKVRGQVCKRLQRRINMLHLDGITAYRNYLGENEGEWPILDGLCRVSISRFYRDKQVFALLEREVMPELAKLALTHGDKNLKVWSAGCGSGEEPYTVALLWHLRLQQQFPGLGLQIRASDADPTLIRRAKASLYRYATIKNLPPGWREEAFTQSGEWYALKPEHQHDTTFVVEDVRQRMPDEHFHLILCRNLVFTYYDEGLQRERLEQIQGVLIKGGALVLGVHETLPQGFSGLAPWSKRLPIYRKTG